MLAKEGFAVGVLRDLRCLALSPPVSPPPTDSPASGFGMATRGGTEAALSDALAFPAGAPALPAPLTSAM